MTKQAKEDSIDCLRSYTATVNAQTSLQEQLVALERIIAVFTDSGDGASSERRDKYLAEKSREKNMLRARLMFVTARRRSIERSLDALDETERTVLDRFFINVPKSEGSAMVLMEELGFEKTQIYRLRDRALRKFCMNMFGDDAS